MKPHEIYQPSHAWHLNRYLNVPWSVLWGLLRAHTNHDHREWVFFPKGWTSEGWTWCSFPQSGEEDDDDQDGEGRKGRKKIRKILKDDKLRTETRDALKEEEDRRKRIAEREALREKLREVTIKCLAFNKSIDSMFKALSCSHSVLWEVI